MSFLRFKLDLAVKRPLPSALQMILPEIKSNILKLKAYCEKINDRNGNEENTINAKYHICRHDEGLPCDQEQDIE